MLFTIGSAFLEIWNNVTFAFDMRLIVLQKTLFQIS